MEYPKYTKIKQTVITNSKSPSAPIDSRNTTGGRFHKEEELLEASGEPRQDIGLESDPGIEEPFLSPDDFIDPPMLAKAGLKIGTKSLPMAAGVISQSLKGTRPFKTLGLKVGENFRGALGKIMNNEFGALGSTAIEKSGKSADDFIRSAVEDVGKNGYELIKKPHGELVQKFNFDAYIDPAKKQLVMPGDLKNPELTAALLTHEGKHIDELANKLIDPNDIINYNDLPPEKLAEIQKLFPDVTNSEELNARIMELMGEGRVSKASSGQNLRKLNHFADPNIKDLERDSALKYLYDASKDEMLPGEIDLLNSVNPRIINPLEAKKAALELIKKKK